MDRDQYIKRLEKLARRRSGGGSCKKCCCGLILVVFILGAGVAYGIHAGWIPLGSWVSFESFQPAQETEEQSSDNTSDEVRTFVLTSEELTNQAQQALGQQADPVIAPDSLQFNISPEVIHISGQLVKPVKSPITITTIPEVVDGRLVFTITEMKVGVFAAPASVRSYVENIIEQQVTSPFNQFLSTQQYHLTEVVLSDDELRANYSYQTN